MKSAIEISEGIRSGELTAEAIIEQACTRCEAVQKQTNAFSSILTERALERAQALDRARKNQVPMGPLCGVPVAVKDNIVQARLPATCGSRLLENYVGSYTATAIERLEAAGAIIVARTNMDEFGMGSSTENCAWGKVLNPWDLSRVPGGSSGGSAVAVASGAVPMALGSDTGGSVRQPASFTGTVGLKPSYGRVSRRGLVAFASSTDQIGPLTRTVADATLALQVMAGFDPADSTSLIDEVPSWSHTAPASLKGVRIGRPVEYFGDGLDPRVREAVDQLLCQLEDLGASIVEVSLPSTELAIACYYIIAPAEASANLARFDGVRYGQRMNGSSVKELIHKTRSRGFGAEVKRRILIGTYVLSSGYFDAYYGSAQRVRQHLVEEFRGCFKEVDALISPTAPTPPFTFGAHEDPIAMYLGDAYTVPASLAGIPAISVPYTVVDSLPVGVQIMSKAKDEQTCFSLAAVVERLRGPPIEPPLFVDT
jgi:aspartyl-tRNA(Asn)/glutamyl-tRNA(Gln) amidotransferase subunit A